MCMFVVNMIFCGYYSCKSTFSLSKYEATSVMLADLASSNTILSPAGGVQ